VLPGVQTEQFHLNLLFCPILPQSRHCARPSATQRYIHQRALRSLHLEMGVRTWQLPIPGVHSDQAKPHQPLISPRTRDWLLPNRGLPPVLGGAFCSRGREGVGIRGLPLTLEQLGAIQFALLGLKVRC
jgi:hypothetical protein